MFLSKHLNGTYHLYYKKSNGKMTSISTKTKLKSEANKFLIKFASRTSSKDEVNISYISVESFSKEFLNI